MSVEGQRRSGVVVDTVVVAKSGLSGTTREPVGDARRHPGHRTGGGVALQVRYRHIWSVATIL
jgi:hypothetical protein